MDGQIYAGDWKVLEQLWSKSPQTLMQLVHTLSREVGWSKSTVATMVRRMETKGLLYFEDGGKARLIYPSLMASLLEQGTLSQKEIDELYGMLRKAEEAKEANV